MYRKGDAQAPLEVPRGEVSSTSQSSVYDSIRFDVMCNKVTLIHMHDMAPVSDAPYEHPNRGDAIVDRGV